MSQFVLVLFPIRPVIRQRPLFSSRALWVTFGPSRTYATGKVPPPPPTDYPPGGSTSSRDADDRLPEGQKHDILERDRQPGVTKPGGVVDGWEATEVGGRGTQGPDEVGLFFRFPFFTYPLCGLAVDSVNVL